MSSVTYATRRIGAGLVSGEPVGYLVIRCEPRRTRLAEFFLRQLLGPELYTPRIKADSVQRGRKVVRRELLFPNYFFSYAGAAPWHVIRRSPGVGGLLMAGDAPAVVADEIVFEIRARERGGLVVLPDRMMPFAVGTTVHIRDGIFAGRRGLFQGMAGAERVSVLLAALRVTLPQAHVQAAS